MKTKTIQLETTSSLEPVSISIDRIEDGIVHTITKKGLFGRFSLDNGEQLDENNKEYKFQFFKIKEKDLIELRKTK